MNTNGLIDVLFINPRDLVGSIPYVRLASAAGVLRSKNILFDILEPAATDTSHEEILTLIAARRPSIICIGVFPSSLPDAFTTIQLIRGRFPDIIIVIEGYHINADPDILLHLGAPYGFRDDIEFVFAEFCQQVLAGQEPDQNLQGMVINCGDHVKVNERHFIRDINTLPIPAFEYLPIGKYYSASQNMNWMAFFTTRGCPYECTFCANVPQLNYRWMSVENTIAQLKFLVRDLGIEWVEFMDLTFTMSRARIMEVCDAIVAEKLEFEWGCETRADKIDKPLLQKMKAAGCKKITFGVESGVEAIRYQSGKAISNQKIKEVFKLCKDNGVKSMANFIFGHPGETAGDMRKTIQFAHELDSFNVLFTKMVPLPDVQIYQTGISEGLIPKDAWVQYMHGAIDLPVYYPNTVSRRDMERIHRWAYISYYMSPYQIKKYLPLFIDLKFMLRSLGIFFRFAFGKTNYK